MSFIDRETFLWRRSINSLDNPAFGSNELRRRLACRHEHDPCVIDLTDRGTSVERTFWFCRSFPIWFRREKRSPRSCSLLVLIGIARVRQLILGSNVVQSPSFARWLTSSATRCQKNTVSFSKINVTSTEPFFGRRSIVNQGTFYCKNPRSYSNGYSLVFLLFSSVTSNKCDALRINKTLIEMGV